MRAQSADRIYLAKELDNPTLSMDEWAVQESNLRPTD